MTGPTTAVYACGAGYGHLTRTRAVLHTLGIRAEAAVVLARPAPDTALADGLRVVPVPEVDDAWSAAGRAELGAGVRRVLEDLGTAHLIVDAFPAGIRGELDAAAVPEGVIVDHVARLVRWDVYAPFLPQRPMRFGTVWRTEPLHPEHDRYLRHHGEIVGDLQLVDPPRAAVGDPVPPGDGRPRWLVVHAGPPDEVRYLADYAMDEAVAEGFAPSDIDLVVVTPHIDLDGLPESARLVAHVPAVDLYPTADRIVTGGGFNAVRQTAAWRDRHLIVPFERPEPYTSVLFLTLTSAFEPIEQLAFRFVLAL